MRHRVHVHKAFEPTRLSAEHLHRAFELVVPPVQREAHRDDDAPERSPPVAARARRSKEGKAA
jgi:hypothetical protein